MPVTAQDVRGRNDLPDLASVLGHINTAAFLFDEDETQNNPVASPQNNSYHVQMTSDDKFPILVRREGDGNGTNPQLSASSAALDLALSQSPGPDGQSNGWNTYRHRQSQQSLPTNTLRKQSTADEYDSRQNSNALDTTPTKSMASNRRSVEFSGFSPYGSESKRSSYQVSPSSNIPKLQQSFSTNDVPTLKNGNSVNGVNGTGVNSHAEQHLHHHNANMGRVPVTAINNRHSRELSASFKDSEAAYRSPQSALHGSATPFGPAMASSATNNGVVGGGTVGSPAMQQFSNTSGPSAPYYGYGMNVLNGAMNAMSLGPQVAPPPVYNTNGMYPGMQQPGMQQQFYNPYATYGPNGRVQDSQARVIQSRRLQNGTNHHQEVVHPSSLTLFADANRFVNYDLKQMPRQEIYTLCKDQHGCRFLQKKLEERNAEYLEIIFEETAPHVVELMTGMSSSFALHLHY